MAFKYVNTGPPLACWSDGDNILVENPTGDISSFPIKLGVSIPRQINDFQSPNVNFCLQWGGIMYVGRTDRTFSGIRMDDRLLVRFGKWEAPMQKSLEFIGTHRRLIGGTRKVMLDTENRRCAYVVGSEKLYVFEQPFDYNLILPTSISESMSNKYGLNIITTEGKVDEHAAGKWFIPDDLWERNHKVPL